MSQFHNNAIFWVEVDKIKPNPFQPRKEFDETKLNDLARSIRQYGVIQPLTVTRIEVAKPDGGLASEYELIAGERRLRAAKLAGVQSVPVLIRAGLDDDRTKLELAIIENIQREDLSPVDRARAFDRLVKEFNFKHHEIGKKVGKSREYVSNSLRILSLPEYIINALSENKITEGHTRPLMMLIDRPEEQETLFKEIIFKKLNVREAEGIARHIAVERARKLIDQELIDIEDLFKEKLGTRVRIEKKPARHGSAEGESGGEEGGRVTIDFFNKDDLRALLERIVSDDVGGKLPEKEFSIETAPALTDEDPEGQQVAYGAGKILVEDEPRKEDDDESLYSVTNFSI